MGNELKDLKEGDGRIPSRKYAHLTRS